MVIVIVTVSVVAMVTVIEKEIIIEKVIAIVIVIIKIEDLDLVLKVIQNQISKELTKNQYFNR